MKVVSAWSGGKDCCLACYRAIQQGHEVTHLVNFLQEDGRRTLSHLVSTDLIAIQSGGAGIPLLQRNVGRDTYEAQFKGVMDEAHRLGARAGVFGDIDLQAHREWIERVCAMSDMEAMFPLWEADRGELMREFIGAGFQAVVVAVLGRVLGPEWLGRNINQQFVDDMTELRKTAGVDLCGEGGEYHTLVTAGPLFKNRIRVTLAQPVLRDEYWFADILAYEVE